MNRPVVGITTYVEPAKWGPWELEAALIPFAYVQAVERAGARALLVPPSEDGVEETVDALDGLLLSGGADLDPENYGADPHPETAGLRPERDRAELALLDAALARDMPVLAVCRGLQVLNVALGGSLYQDVGTDPGTQVLHSQTEPRDQPTHKVKVTPGSRLAETLGADELEVNSMHHQAIKRLGRGLTAVAWAPDQIVEGAELGDPARFVLGVQWHPEEQVGHSEPARRLFAALVAAARKS